MTSKLGIYVHVPFCESKCIYCDFASFVTPQTEKNRYFRSLLDEIKSSHHVGREVDTIYIGGGTPSCVNVQQIGEILSCIRENFRVDENAEISIECNPNSADVEKIKAYREFGINRISFGIQSLQDDALKEIGRLHSADTAMSALENARKCGFENINADLLIGLPNSDQDKLLRDAKTILPFVTHISAYMLQVENGTELFNRVQNNPFYLPSEDESVDMYSALADFLSREGLDRYEISNFAKPGFECKHNLKYWSGEGYLGFGLGAHSYINGERFANSKNFQEYYLRQNIMKEKLTDKEKIEERLMLGLRSKVGVNKDELLALGYDITKNSSYNEFLERKILTENGNIIFLSPQFYGISNYVIIKLMI